jgi:Domain of unknown function (DUF4149)
MMRAWPVWVAAVWLVSLSTVGFVVVPQLFLYLPTPAMAGNMAAHLFSTQTIISAACALLLLLLVRSNKSLVPVDIAPAATLLIVAGLLFALLVELGVAPRIVARENLRLWHTVGTALYALQWGCACMLLVQLTRKRSHPAT